ncbi:hypothetical protein PT974_05374 [Cladobotryum mycophilum]|uniref:Telomeric single stranded DNA binding POT1/Cdc13 domain-containing protein n=1 Tax=Cladobotryum mycophilum TaxID=491253 RepID=A0ABR0SIL1_9HYPO
MATLDPTAITPLSREDPFTLVPLIRRMLTTRRCIPGSVFIVEGLDIIPIPESEDVQAIRLVLGDGELCVQAILHSDLFDLVEREDVYVGCYVRVDDFVMRFEDPSEHNDESQGKRGMVYLIVNDLEIIGWNETYVAMWRREQKGKGVERPPEQHQPIDMNEDERKSRGEMKPPQTPQKSQKHTMEDTPIKLRDMTISSPQTPKPKYRSPQVEDVEDDGDMGDAFDSYKAFTFPSQKSTPKKPTPKKETTKRQTPTKERPSTPTPGTRAEEAEEATSKSQQPVALPQDWHNHQVPLKLTTLRSIPHLPYAQNWSVNVLAIVVSLSDVEPSHLPPGKQRTARIADPSTSKHVHLTVFLDPEGFNPKVGSAVLLTGVKNHRFDGGSLKKYASDAKKANGQQWWFEDPLGMKWLDVKGIKGWWAEMEDYISQGDIAIDF